MKTIFGFRFSIFDFPRLAAALATVMAFPSDAAAQGCAMCYQSASAAKSAGLEALQNGILILLVPPLLIFAAILWQTFHRGSAEQAVEMELCKESESSTRVRAFDSLPQR